MNRLRLWKYLMIMMALLVMYLGISSYSHVKLKTVTINNAHKSQQVSSTPIKKTKAVVQTDDPFISCSNESYLCEEAILPTKQEFSYSNYIWAEAGEVIKFGGTSQGSNEVVVWIEDESGSFNSVLGIVKPNETKNFSIQAPSSGNYRLVIQNQTKNAPGSGFGFIKDAWAAG